MCLFMCVHAAVFGYSPPLRYLISKTFPTVCPAGFPDRAPTELCDIAVWPEKYELYPKLMVNNVQDQGEEVVGGGGWGGG